jgi:hypothetical protein
VTRPAVRAAIAFPALFAFALVVRFGQLHAALLYPDGYQYLLMARGISEHLQLTTELGPGGDVFEPNPDAAAKPFFPLAVAAVHLVGASWLEAARIVTAIAGAVSVGALALLVTKLSGSRLAGISAGVLLLASPSAGFWAGFAGPDPLAQALALSAALAFVHRRPVVGGVLTGLAVCTRPEIALVAAAAALVALRSDVSRRDLARAAPVAVLTPSAVILALRAPLPVPDTRFLWLAPLACAVAAALAFTPVGVLRVLALAGGAVIVGAFVTQVGPGELWHQDWPLLALGAAGLLVLLRDERHSPVALAGLGVVILLGAVYVLKNPMLARYFTQLVPVAAMLAGVAVASGRGRVQAAAVGAVVAVTALGVANQVPGSRDYDMFAVVARQVAPRLESSVLVTAAPDAYGFWLPANGVRGMRPGAHGVVLLDAAQRVYEPELSAEGDVVARVTDEIAFSRPDGGIDAEPAVLVSGRVVARGRPSGRSD